MCASHGKNSLIIGTRAYKVNKNHIMISRGRSLIGGVGCSIHDLPLSYLNSWAETILVITGMWPLARVMGFLNFSKYLVSDSISGKAVYFWHFDSKSIFQNIFWIWTLLCFSISHCTCEIRFRTTGVRTVGLVVSERSTKSRATVSSNSAGERWELDLKFMMWNFIYIYMLFA